MAREAAVDRRVRCPLRWLRCPTWARPARVFPGRRLARARARAPPHAREPARERRRGAGRAWERPRSWARGCPCRRRDRLPCRLMSRWEDKRDRVGQRTSERHGIETASREEGMGVPIETMEKVFFASIAHDRAGTRGGARDATSDLGHAPRRSSRLPSLGLSRSRRPAGLAPWGAGLGACGVEGGRKGSRGQSQSRVVSGQRFWQPPLGVVSVGRDSRSEDAAPGRKRAGGGGCGITHVLLLRSLLGHRLELFHCGVGGYGKVWSARVWARDGKRAPAGHA